MAGTATLSATESAIVSTTKLNVLLHTSCSNPFSAKLSFPYRSHKIGICHRSKPSNSTSEGAQEIIDDEAFFFDGDGLAEDDETDEEDDDAESSIDLLLRFLQSMFKKISKRAKKATRSVLPAAIPTQLVSFAVDGILLLASLSIIKAFLEVVCTLGGTVFSVILLLRVIWASLSYFQSSGSIFNQSGSSFGTTQPIT
ncbi:protein SHORT HYPOCOTYL IN WHITE LIGHT 1 isoform X1 [Ziziphus jujuba]|uniref:Protein SHORT HYPOCOTYL IN WHITE LIGHT 1 isoform X1 n=2 Tax=Ziziphus jujuba TaxID=326968 RepID=A0ABM3I293_ZIZJJ|nr:protein SHORT HYPOCOTYL IN WHITE LIGHT 1 isoform X1 [Ziziphus jujuba]KAH7515837.1 hypothetical protein FEM48_Zijuj10G0068600 [Ziziphus jujuba var. spinosa]